MSAIRRAERTVRAAGLYAGALCVLWLCGCGERRTLEQQASLFERWFVSPSATRTDSLLREVVRVERLGTIAARAVSHARVRQLTGTVVLHDSTGTAWTLGYGGPAGTPADSLLPLVVYLHGGIGSAAESKGARAWEMLAPLIDSCGAVVISPTATARAPWWSAAGMGRILQALRWATLHLPVDPERVVLAGVSDGALGCYAASSVMAGPFAGFIAVSGFGGILPALGVSLVPGNMMQRPIYTVNAGRDRLFPLEKVNAFLDELEAQGVRVERAVHPEEEHGFDYRASEMGALARRVRQWRQPAGRRGISWRIQQGLPWRADNLVSAAIARGTAGLPAINASWHKGRLTAQCIGLQSFVFLAEPGGVPPVVVVNGHAEERCRDVSGDVRTVLTAMQHSCVPRIPRSAIYSATIQGE